MKTNLTERVQTQEVSQDSILGSLAMTALAQKYCGPPCNLSDLPVHVSKSGGSIDITFYDMSISIAPGKKYHSELNAALATLEQRSEKTVSKKLIPQGADREIPIQKAMFLPMVKISNLVQSLKNIYYHLALQDHTHHYSRL